MKDRRLSRRQVLRGLGGFTLALPFLPSLAPKSASGQELPRQPRFFAMSTDHGAVNESAMFPDTKLLTSSLDLYSGMSIRYGKLVRQVSGSTAKLSTVLAAPADQLTDSIVSKMNVLYGLDIPFYIAHHTGGHLGNYARNDGNGSDGKAIQEQMMPTIDQLMAWSPSFYPDIASIKERSITVGPKRGLSWGWSNPAARNGTIQEVRTDADPLNLFHDIFVPSGQPKPAPRELIVDRVVKSYLSLRQSNRRLSTADKQRLDDHMARLAELQRKLQARPAQTGAACGALPEPGQGGNAAADLHALTDVIAAAFICGTCRVAVLGTVESYLVQYAGDWHQNVAHKYTDPAAQDLLQQANRAAFTEAFVELARKLDVEDVPGRTVLDDTLMTWSQESGQDTHVSRSMPVVTAGSAAGALKTGLFVDYRNRAAQSIVKSYGDEMGPSGLLYSQWLATCLEAMRIPQTEWQNVPNNGKTGYSLPLIDGDYAPTYVNGVVSGASQMLPIIGA